MSLLARVQELSVRASGQSRRAGRCFIGGSKYGPGRPLSKFGVLGEKSGPAFAGPLKNQILTKDDLGVGLLELGDFLEDRSFALSHDFAVLVNQLVVRDSKPA